MKSRRRSRRSVRARRARCQPWPPPAPAGSSSACCWSTCLHLHDETVRQRRATSGTLTGLPCFALIPEVGRRALGHCAIDEYAARRPLTVFAEQVRALRAGLSLSADRPHCRGDDRGAAVRGQVRYDPVARPIRSVERGKGAGDRVRCAAAVVPAPPRTRAGARPDGHPARPYRLARPRSRTDPVTGMHVHPGRASRAATSRVFPVGRDAPLPDRGARPLRPGTARCPAGRGGDGSPHRRFAGRRHAAVRALAVHAGHDLAACSGDAARCPRQGYRNDNDRVDPRAHLRSGYADAAIYHRRYKTYYRG